MMGQTACGCHLGSSVALGTRMVREGFPELIKGRPEAGQSKRGGEGYKDVIPDRRPITCQGQEVSVSLYMQVVSGPAGSDTSFSYELAEGESVLTQ